LVVAVGIGGTDTADGNFGGTAQTGGVAGDGYACCFAGKGVNHIGVFGARQFVAAYLLGGVGKRGFFFLDAHGCYDNGFQSQSFFFHLDLQRCTAVKRNVYRLIADIGNDQSGIGRCVEGEFTVQIGNDAVGRSLLQYVGTDNRFAFGVGDNTFYGDSFLLYTGNAFNLFAFLGQNDVLAFHYISDVGSGKNFVQQFGYRFVFSFHVNSAAYIYAFFVIHKQILCLRFDFGKHLTHSQLGIGDTDFGILRVTIPAVCLECYKQEKE